MQIKSTLSKKLNKFLFNDFSLLFSITAWDKIIDIYVLRNSFIKDWVLVNVIESALLEYLQVWTVTGWGRIQDGQIYLFL